jgi:hypothetical protein
MSFKKRIKAYRRKSWKSTRFILTCSSRTGRLKCGVLASLELGMTEEIQVLIPIDAESPRQAGAVLAWP